MSDFGSFLAGMAPVDMPALAKTAGATAVQETAELRRIRDAAWRPWDAESDLDYGRLALTHHLRVLGGTRELKHVQAAVLRTLFDCRGCFAPVRTGGGKTDISLLAAEVMRADRALLLVPASVREKTKRNAAALAKHYRVRTLRIFSYESLSLAKHANILIDWQPDLFILDEAHKCKDSGGARWKRIRRYDDWCKRNDRELVPMLAMSGSFTSRSIREYWHIIRRCLRGSAPVPTDPIEMSAWALAIDEKIAEGARVHAGALLQLAKPEQGEPSADDERQLARARYGRRLVATKGVVSSGGDMPPCGLEIDVVQIPPTPEMAAAVKHLRTTWETPCGLPFETAMELWRHEREVSAGLYYRWKVQPPSEWRIARKDWSMFVRGVLSTSKNYDTPMQVAVALYDGSWPRTASAWVGGETVLAEWQRVEPSFKSATEPVWICDSTLRYCAEWLEREQGICWVHHGAFGRALETMTGVPYFKQQGKNEAGVAIDQHRGPAIASIMSCSVGFDLQGTAVTEAQHHKNLIATCPTRNLDNEQLLSRTHRDGQEEDTVFARYLQRLEGDVKALEQSRADARMVELTTRAPQRLTVATWLDE